MPQPRRPLLAAGLAAGVAALLPAGVRAQGTPPIRIRGTIAGLEGNVLTVTTREGTRLGITLAESVTVSALRRVELSSIEPNAYVGIATQQAADGMPEALEVLVFPEAARGSGEGHYAWDLAPGTMMTNATVDATVQASAGRELSLSYRGGSIRIRVPEGVPVVTPIPAARADLVLGAQVFLVATRGADGALSAARVTVAKDGVVPPM